MQRNDFYFPLPVNQIARYPLKKRSASRLLSLNRETGLIKHQLFINILDGVVHGDLLVFNDTRVIPARLLGKKKTGGAIEVLVERVLDAKRMLAQVRVSKPPKVGDALFFAGGVVLQVVRREAQFYELNYDQDKRHLLEVIESIGQIPLPPYLARQAEASDKERYQTVYAKHKGSVAAPTAGFHFDEELLQQLRDKGIDMGYLTLHIGAGTFAPVRVDDISEHQMHAEYFVVTEALREQIARTKARGKRVIAVGTTTLRALESAASSGEIKAFRGETRIFIYPGYTFRCVDALITNLHLPSSTLLMLVAAFGGHAYIMQAYREAVSEGYRFYSYGDAMWVG